MDPGSGTGIIAADVPVEVDNSLWQMSQKFLNTNIYINF